MAELITYPEHQGYFEQFADKGIKWGASSVLALLGILSWSAPPVFFGLVTYFAGDVMADIAAKVRRGNTEAHHIPSDHH